MSVRSREVNRQLIVKACRTVSRSNGRTATIARLIVSSSKGCDCSTATATTPPAAMVSKTGSKVAEAFPRMSACLQKRVRE